MNAPGTRPSEYGAAVICWREFRAVNPLSPGQRTVVANQRASPLNAWLPKLRSTVNRPFVIGTFVKVIGEVPMRLPANGSSYRRKARLHEPDTALPSFINLP